MKIQVKSYESSNEVFEVVLNDTYNIRVVIDDGIATFSHSYSYEDIDVTKIVKDNESEIVAAIQAYFEETVN